MSEREIKNKNKKFEKRLGPSAACLSGGGYRRGYYRVIFKSSSIIHRNGSILAFHHKDDSLYILDYFKPSHTKYTFIRYAYVCSLLLRPQTCLNVPQTLRPQRRVSALSAPQIRIYD